MKQKKVAFLLASLIFLVSTSVFAGNTGKLKVNLKDEHGFSTDGLVTAKRGTQKKTCRTAGGTCTLKKLTPGKWVITAKVGKKKGGPKVIKIIKNKTLAVMIPLKKVSLPKLPKVRHSQKKFLKK